MKTFLEKHCNKEWLSFINHHKQILTYEKGEQIFDAGEETKGLFIIESGKVKITYKQFDGSQRVIRLATTGDVLGHRGFGGNWTYPISAVVLEKTQVSFIPVGALNTIMKSNSTFTYNLLMFFAEELRKSEANIKQYPVKILVARALLDNYKVFGLEENSPTKLNYTLSRKDIASKAGTTYETTIRTLTEFKKTGIINLEGKDIHIMDIDKLRSFARPN